MNCMSSTSNSSNLEMQKNFKSAKFAILQHYCNRSTNVMQTVLEYAVKNVNIVLLQESWIENDNISISHFAFIKIAFNIEQNVKARTMTFVSKNAKLNYFSRYNILNHSNIQMLNISSNVKNFIIFNVYNEKYQDENQSYAVERKLTSIDIPEKAFICEDFNALIRDEIRKFKIRFVQTNWFHELIDLIVNSSIFRMK